MESLLLKNNKSLVVHHSDVLCERTGRWNGVDSCGFQASTPPETYVYIYSFFQKIYICMCSRTDLRRLALFRLPWHSLKNVGTRGDNTPNASIHAAFNRPSLSHSTSERWTTS